MSNTPIENRPPDPRRLIGMGKPLKTGVGAREMVQPIIDGLKCDISKIPVIHQTRWDFNGPLVDSAINTLYGATCDIFGAGKAPVGVNTVQSTMPINGELQTYALIAGVFYHLEPEPLSFVIPGNAWSVAGTAMPSANAISPISPDVFSQVDLSNVLTAATSFAANSSNALGVASLDTLTPSLLNWGRWANYAAWHLVRAYNYTWAFGMHQLLADIPLRHIAYMPSNAERGSVGTIDVETSPYVNRVNSYYRSPTGGTAATASFVKQNARRTGCQGGGTNPISTFAQDRSFDRVSAVYGGMGLRDLLRGNSEVFRLPAPYGVRPGVALGMYLQAKDNQELTYMRNELSITQGLGLGSAPNTSVPPSIYDDPNITGQGGWTKAAGCQLTQDSPPVAVTTFQYPAVRQLFKGGSFFQTVGMVGYEISEQQWQVLLASNDARSVLDEAFGCQLL